MGTVLSSTRSLLGFEWGVRRPQDLPATCSSNLLLMGQGLPYPWVTCCVPKVFSLP